MSYISSIFSILFNNQSEIQQVRSILMQGQQFHYPQCTKGDCHIGEVLNLVCLQPGCIQKSIICGICYDEEHRNHKIRPLKLIINHSLKYLEGLTPLSLDVEKLRSSVKDTKANLLTTFSEFEKYVKDSLESIRSNIDAIFIKVLEQIQLKAGATDQLVKSLEDIKMKEMKYDAFVSLMQKLLAGVPLDQEEDEGQISGSEIEQAVATIQKKVEKDLKAKETKIRAEIESFSKILQKTAENPCLFDSKIDFKFSNEMKHNGISVVSDNLIKSTEGYNYHFGLLQPSLQQKGNRACKVAFKIKQNSNNWLAVGICYKNVVANSNYTFNYSSLGHGAYLVSSNGGSWSSIDAGKNNTVNAFNYYVGDTIIVEYDPNETKVVFRKKGTEESHTIEFQVKQDDELYLCGLFYYNNDQIEFSGYDQE